MTATPHSASQAPAGTGDTTETTAGTVPIRFGFTRGVAPSKWADRWAAAAPGQSLELIPFATPFGRGTGSEEFDMIIERAAPGERPERSERPRQASDGALPRTHHAMRLYEEAVALVVPRDHDLAESEEIIVEDLGLIKILDHPNHSPEWPEAEEWIDPSWMPQNFAGALELVATGLGGILAPMPLARHTIDKRKHAVLRVMGAGGERNPLEGSTIWATWRVERDAADVQQLAGVMRGRTSRSSRSAAAASEREAAAQAAKLAKQAKRQQQQQQQKKKPQLKPNSRGAQLQAAREKAERAKAAKRRAKRR